MRYNSERGSAIMEAVMIFPFIILLIIMLMTLGNAYYQRSRVEAIVETKTINGAAYCANSLLREYMEKGELPTSTANAPEIEPYRYLFSGGTRNIVQGTEDEIAKAVKALGTGYFRGMEVQNFVLKLDYKNYFITQTVAADASYYINLPINVFGTQFKLQCSSHLEIPLSDSPEFIRNVDMVIDYLERTQIDDKFREMIEKVKTFFE